jgi:hypothetical protein
MGGGREKRHPACLPTGTGGASGALPAKLGTYQLRNAEKRRKRG